MSLQCMVDMSYLSSLNNNNFQEEKNVITRLSIKDNFHLSYVRDLQREKSTPFWFEIWNFKKKKSSLCKIKITSYFTVSIYNYSSYNWVWSISFVTWRQF